MELEQTVLDHVIAHHMGGGRAWAMARNVQRRIAGDDGGLSCFTYASQNIAAAAAMFRHMTELATPDEHRAHREIHTLLERAAVQQAESSMSQRRELDASQGPSP